MKQELVLVLFAATASLTSVGCSSAPLSAPESAGAAAGTPSSGGAGAAPGAPTITSDWVDYPAGPYGTVVGATIENLEFMGWKHPDLENYDPANFEKVRLSDFYNPDNQSTLKLLAVNASAVWCSVCRAEYEDMNTNGTYATYSKEGVEILGTLFQDNAYYPAQPSDLINWGETASHAVKFPLVLDPGFKMGAYFDSDATPLNMVIDVRTMTIVLVTMGYSTTYWSTVQGLLAEL
jgi:AhpC/TSA family